MYGDEYAAWPKAVEGGANESQELQPRIPTHDGGSAGTCAGFGGPPFVDDIIIRFGTEDMSEDELIGGHEEDLRGVLDILDPHQMVCKPTKASVLVKEVVFAVRHAQRRRMPGELAALNHWERPTTISELRSFMGFCNFFSGYVQMYAKLSGPLHKMLQVGKFDGRKGSKKKLPWTAEAEETFKPLKRTLLGKLGLFSINRVKGFVLHTDASDYAVGAVLEQV